MGYETFVLDKSILDLDAWLPKEAMEEIVQAILRQEKLELNSLAESNPQYITEISFEDVKAKYCIFSGYVSSKISNSAYQVRVKDMAA